MGSTVEQIMASYLAHQIARRLDLTPQAGGNPSVRAIPPPNSRSAGDATSLGRVIGGPSSYGRNRDKSRLWIETH